MQMWARVFIGDRHQEQQSIHFTIYPPPTSHSTHTRTPPTLHPCTTHTLHTPRFQIEFAHVLRTPSLSLNVKEKQYCIVHPYNSAAAKLLLINNYCYFIQVDLEISKVLINILQQSFNSSRAVIITTALFSHYQSHSRITTLGARM